MFEDWRDWRSWLLILLVVGFYGTAFLALTAYGGPECVHGYDETGCWGGIIQYNGLAVFLLLVALIGVFLIPYLVFDVMGVPTIKEAMARSRGRRRRLFQWLEET